MLQRSRAGYGEIGVALFEQERRGRAAMASPCSPKAKTRADFLQRFFGTSSPAAGFS